MKWLKAVIGVILALIGLVWIGQGTMLLPGSFMSGHIQWAIIGLVVLVVGIWLLWSAFRPRRPSGVRSA
ncbi:MAG: hypothetical protein ACREOS_09795 [Candidatus Dormibacteraceae bacterium]